MVHLQQQHSHSLALAVLTAFLLLLVTTGTVQGQETITAPVVPTATSTEGPESSNDQQGGSQTRLKEPTVTERRPTTAASSETIRARDYDLRPHTTTQEILNNVPGLNQTTRDSYTALTACEPTARRSIAGLQNSAP